MSVKIKVSYQTRDELDRVLTLLHPVMKSYKVSGNREGGFQKAYVYLDEPRMNPGEPRANNGK